jgi:CheY-like chemotaxis protein
MEAVTAPARLLVVDDEATILELLSGSLRLMGFEVVTAASGAGAVLKRTRPDGPRPRLRVVGLELDEDAHEVISSSS